MLTLIKKGVAALPLSGVRRIYVALSSVWPFRPLVNGIIRMTIPSTLALDEGVLILNQKDEAMSGALVWGVYEPYETKVFRDTVKSGMTVIDVGANLGYYTLIAGTRAGKDGRIFAYEPEEYNFSLLSRNIRSNNLSNTTPLKQALADAPREADFYIAKGHSAIHSFADNRGNSDHTTVSTDTLDHSLAQYGSPKVDLIKMDIEGGEPFAIEGMRETIARSPGVILFTEFYPKAIKRLGKDPLRFLERLAELGFSLSVIDEDAKRLISLADFRHFLDTFPRGEAVRNIYAVKIN